MKSAYCEVCGERIMHPDFPPEAPWVHTTAAAFTSSPVHLASPAHADAAAEPDLSDCPYYRSWQDGGGDGKCNRGCHDEPSCITDEPAEGWPSRRVAANDLPTDDPWTLHGEAQATLRTDGEREERR